MSHADRSVARGPFWWSMIHRWCDSIAEVTLRHAGFKVEQAINGLEAMEKVLVTPFDLVIVDVNMPGMDGISFVRTLRADGRRCVFACRVLIVSTEAGARDREDARPPARISISSSRFRKPSWSGTSTFLWGSRHELAAGAVCPGVS